MLMRPANQWSAIIQAKVTLPAEEVHRYHQSGLKGLHEKGARGRGRG